MICSLLNTTLPRADLSVLRKHDFSQLLLAQTAAKRQIITCGRWLMKTGESRICEFYWYTTNNIEKMWPIRTDHYISMSKLYKKKLYFELSYIVVFYCSVLQESTALILSAATIPDSTVGYSCLQCRRGEPFFVLSEMLTSVLASVYSASVTHFLSSVSHYRVLYISQNLTTHCIT